MATFYCTTVEATKGEQIKVCRWEYHPETKLLAAQWKLVASYLTVDLAKAPAKLQAQPWVRMLQPPQLCPCGRKLDSVWLWVNGQYTQLHGCTVCDGPAPAEYCPSTVFGSMPPRQAKAASLPTAQQPASEAASPSCVHCGAPRSQHYATGACFTGSTSYTATGGQLPPEQAAALLAAGTATVPYAGQAVSTEGEQVHREAAPEREAVPEGVCSLQPKGLLDRLLDQWAGSRMFGKGGE